MSTVKTNNVQVGQSLTATNNFTWYQPSTPDGTVRLGVGNSGATTADVASVTSAGVFSFNSGYGSIATAYGCRAWVNFNGTGTVAIRNSGNVSSITDGGVGLYTVNMTSALVDVNYAVTTGVSGGSTTNPTAAQIFNQSTTAFELRTFQGANSLYDQSLVCAAVFR